jgi:hypothetical protein
LHQTLSTATASLLLLVAALIIQPPLGNLAFEDGVNSTSISDEFVWTSIKEDIVNLSAALQIGYYLNIGLEWFKNREQE